MLTIYNSLTMNKIWKFPFWSPLVLFEVPNLSVLGKTATEPNCVYDFQFSDQNSGNFKVFLQVLVNTVSTV